jgi:signal transduction histidine kinase
VSSQIGELAGDLSSLSHRLHPSRLQTLGLIESMRLLCSEISQRRQVTVGFHASELPGTVDPRVSLCLYRIAQEALHNVVEHAGATHVSVLLQHSDDETVLVIEDNGRGFRGSSGDVQMDDSGWGLVSMRERAMIAGGRFEIESRPSGTAIFIRVPHIVESV